jgi:hypothetical protein
MTLIKAKRIVRKAGYRIREESKEDLFEIGYNLYKDGEPLTPTVRKYWCDVESVKQLELGWAKAHNEEKGVGKYQFQVYQEALRDKKAREEEARLEAEPFEGVVMFDGGRKHRLDW